MPRRRGGNRNDNTPGAGGGRGGNNNAPPPPPVPPQIAPVGGDNRGAFGGSLGGIATGAGIGFVGSQLFGGNDTALGSALDNVSEGVGTGIGALGQGAGGAINEVGGGLGDFMSYLPLVLAVGGVFVIMNMSNNRR